MRALRWVAADSKTTVYPSVSDPEHLIKKLRLLLPSRACQNGKHKTRKSNGQGTPLETLNVLLQFRDKLHSQGRAKIPTFAQLSLKTRFIFSLSFLGSSSHVFVWLRPPSQFSGCLKFDFRLIRVSPGTGNARPWVEHGASIGSIPKGNWTRRAQLSARGLLDRAEAGHGTGCYTTPRPLSKWTCCSWTDLA